MVSLPIKEPFGFINPGLTLIWEMEGDIYGISPVKPPPVVILWLMAISTNNRDLSNKWIPSGYVQIAMENDHRNSEFSHEKW